MAGQLERGTGWDNAVIYQIYPRSFMDANGDGVGDLAGATARLPHIAKLGADMVWVSPFYPSPMKDFGYDVSDYCNVAPLFGTLEAFDTFVATAHKLGLGVMIDLVLSHTSDQHQWFGDSRNRRNGREDWYVWADARADGTPPNNWLSIFGGSAWEWETTRQQYYLHNFLIEQPDLNFHTPAVRAALLDVARFWLSRGVDGFRLDTVNFYYHDAALRDNPPMKAEEAGATNLPTVNPYGMQRHVYSKTRPENVEFLRDLRAVCDEAGGGMLLGEVGAEGDGLRVVADYTRERLLHTAYSFDFLGGAWSPAYFRERLQAWQAAETDGLPCWAFSNHDVMRHVSRWRDAADGDDMQRRRAVLCAAVLLSLRGNVCLYQGEEWGLTEADVAYEDLQDPYGKRFWPMFKGRDGCRTPMPWEAEEKNAGFSTADKTWLPIPSQHVAWCGGDDSGQVFAFYQEMLAFRRHCRELQGGNIELIDDGHAQVLAFWRGGGLLTVFNFSTESQTWCLPESSTVENLECVPYFNWNKLNKGEENNSVELPPLGFIFAREGD